LLLAEAMANVNESFVSHLASQGTLYAFLLSGQTYGTKRPNLWHEAAKLFDKWHHDMLDIADLLPRYAV